jgi:uncharacterized SAM-binding protein YcdF (DUF218 family)
MEHLKLVVGTLILPPAAPILLVVAGMLAWRRAPRLGRTLVWTGAVALWLLSTGFVADRLERLAERVPALPPAQVAATGAQAIVILGGPSHRGYAPEYGGPAAYAELLERLTYGAWLAHQTGLPVLVTGYQDEASAMRDTLIRNFAITPRWVDDRAYDTYDNASDAARLLRRAQVERILLVSSAAHLWRAEHEFAATGLSVVAAPVDFDAPAPVGWRDFLPNPGALATSTSALHEFVGEFARQAFAWSGIRRHRDRRQHVAAVPAIASGQRG